jgi:hypothetical protein
MAVEHAPDDGSARLTFMASFVLSEGAAAHEASIDQDIGEPGVGSVGTIVGKLIVKLVPAPGWDSTSMVPPCSWMMP